jgi:hypothetical protein
MKKLDFFAPNNSMSNSDVGPRNAAVMTFAGDVSNSFVKELTQNSLDAREVRDGDLLIKIKAIEINKKEIPGFDKFQFYLDKMSDYWTGKSNQYKTLFETARSSVSSSKLSILVFEDFLTKGLSGVENGGTFKSCVLDENVSQKKHGDALGSYGIGKNSVFGYSAIQTVFYSTYNSQYEYKFQGVSKLGTFEIDGEKKYEKIFYGLVDDQTNQVEEVSNIDQIPSIFRRTEKGLSQFVIGAQIDEGWKENLIRAFIINYWMLFEKGKLKVEIQDTLLEKENYYQFANELFTYDSPSKDNPLYYIKAYREGQVFSKNINHLGEVFLHIFEADDNFPNKMLILRSGMKIKLDSLFVKMIKSVACVMYCDNEFGNQVLGAMEPPAHDDFKAAFIINRTLSNGKTLSVSDGEKILKEIDQFKREQLLAIREKYSESVTTLDFIDDIFNSLENGISGNNGKNTAEEESFNKKPKIIDYQCLFSASNKNKLVSNLTDMPNLIDTPGIGDDDGSGAGIGEGGAGIIGGQGKISSHGGGGNSQESKKEPKAKQKISTRLFHSSELDQGNIYTLVISSQVDVQNFSLALSQSGDSANRGTMSSILKEVTTIEGEQIIFDSITDSNGGVTGYKLKNIVLDADEKAILKLKFDEKFRSGFNLN